MIKIYDLLRMNKQEIQLPLDNLEIYHMSNKKANMIMPLDVVNQFYYEFYYSYMIPKWSTDNV